jgi:hypothetical protein
MSKTVAVIKQVESKNNVCVGCCFDSNPELQPLDSCTMPDGFDCGDDNIYKMELV